MIAEGIVRCRIFANSYRDSVELMRIASELEGRTGVSRAGLVMATPANQGVLRDAGLLDATSAGAGPNDLVVAVAAIDDATADGAIGRAAALIEGAGEDGAKAGNSHAFVPTTLREAVDELPGADVCLISTPGTYATAEALKALKRGLHVFLFSDNVPLEDEIELKALASRKGLLLMGPDCGTAILDGVPFGFANAVRRGSVGLIGASGTGLQQVSCLVDRAGTGISQAIGVGGRDLDERVGGVMMLAALARLAADPTTRVIVLISKPPAPSVAARVLEAVRAIDTPVVVNFLGGDPEAIRGVGAVPASTFEDAAQAAAVIAAGGTPVSTASVLDAAQRALAAQEATSFSPGQVVVRGLYSGGSLAGEAKILLKAAQASYDVIDLGDDEYTVGRPHPMIDPRLRSERIVAAGADPTVAVVLLDIVLGTASHPDPAGAITPSIVQARGTAEWAGRHLAVVASVCGTPADAQGLERQEAELREAGVSVLASNAAAARFAVRLVEGRAS
ncbi:MAG: acyl-CoA synthetase FdrA [Candidatus Limnocylindrales bacterium]